MDFAPRVIRLKEASKYLGMDKNRFNAEVRPHLVEIPIGDRGIGYDRLDLDRWFEDYKARNGRPGATRKGGDECQAKGRSRALSNAVASGTSKKMSGKSDFEKALALVRSEKQNDT